MADDQDNDFFDFPSADEAGFGNLRKALISATRKMIEVGYPAGDLAAALVATGTTLAFDMGGGDCAAKLLDRCKASVEAADRNASPLNGPVAGHA